MLSWILFGASHMALSVLGAHAPRLRVQNPMANMDMAAFPGRTYRYLQVRRPSLQHSASFTMVEP